MPRSAAMRKCVWIHNQKFEGFGCSECNWVFKPSGPPVGVSLDEMKRTFEAQRDEAFAAHLCAKAPKSPEHKH
jgi:hypothetical protein